MADQFPIVGYIVGSDEYTYKSFTADDGKTVDGGTNRYVFVGNDDLGAPRRVKVDADTYVRLCRAGFGSAVSLLCTPFPKGRQIEWRCDSVLESAAA